MTWTLAGYRAENLIGRGGFGEVWSGVHLATGEPVALKRLPAATVADRDRATAEASVLARLDHPNLIGLREFVPGTDTVVLALELASGGSLAELIGRRDSLTPAEVSACLSPVAAALAYAHDAGVTHGDVSAGNVLFTAAGRAKLADLGLSRLLTSVSGGGALGTPAYIDPVIAAGGLGGAASDVFSLAAVAFHALTGAGPWRSAGTDVNAVLALAATGRVCGLSELGQHCPDDMARTIRRALDPDPARRGTAAEFALDLRASAEPRPVALSAGRVGGAKHRAPLSGATPQPGQPLVRVPTDLTNIARPQVRVALDTVPSERARGRFAGIAVSVGGVVAAIAVVLGASTLWLHRPQARASGAQPRPSSSAVAVTEPVTPSSTPVPSLSRTATAQALPDASAELRRLDDMRQAAFAHRDVVQLRRVYVATTLADEDVSQLLRIVPVGCVLAGVHTTYGGITTRAQSTDRIEVDTIAAVSPSHLNCVGRPDQVVAGVPAVSLRLVLSHAVDGRFAIESITRR